MGGTQVAVVVEQFVVLQEETAKPKRLETRTWSGRTQSRRDTRPSVGVLSWLWPHERTQAYRTAAGLAGCPRFGM